eukprot:jgi/Ulvmu1/12477/UM009_0129.1
MSDKKCIVCSSPAEIFCHNDNAYLCALCDATVHQAHPLAASHVREPIGKATSCDNIAHMFDVPTVPDALCNVKETAVPKIEQGRLGSLDLSFDDDAFFAVPDTAGNAAPRTSLDNASGPLGKGFISDDLFGFDAGFDDFGFGMDNGAVDILEDCLVPDADTPVMNPTEMVDDLPFEVSPNVSIVATAAPQDSASDAVPFPGDASPATSPTAASAESLSPASVPNFDNYLPISLLPVNSERYSALQERRMKVHLFWEKKKTRQFKKTIRYASRKRYAEVRPRIKGRFARKDEILAAQAAGVPLM